MKFEQSKYKVCEYETLQFALVLSKEGPADIKVVVEDRENTATRESHNCNYKYYAISVIILNHTYVAVYILWG